MIIKNRVAFNLKRNFGDIFILQAFCFFPIYIWASIFQETDFCIGTQKHLRNGCCSIEKMVIQFNSRGQFVDRRIQGNCHKGDLTFKV